MDIVTELCMFFFHAVSTVAMSTTSRVAMESPISSEMNEESDPDVDFMEDYDSEEDRRSRRKRKVLLCFVHHISQASTYILYPACQLIILY